MKPIYLTHSQTATPYTLFRAEAILRSNGFQPERRIIGQVPADTHMRVAILPFPHVPHMKFGCDVAREAVEAFNRGADVFEILLNENTIQRISQRSLKERTLDTTETLQLEAFRTNGLAPLGTTLEAHLSMHLALLQSDFNDIKIALSKDIDWSKPSPVIGTTWLMHCMEKRRLEWSPQQASQVLLMMRAGMSPHEVNAKGETMVMLACATKNNDTLKVFLKHGVDPNAQDNDGWTALMRLSMLSQSYKNRGQEPDSVDGTCAVLAKSLLEYGADPNHKPQGSTNTALRLAAAKGLVQTCRVLVEAGAKFDIRDSKMRRASDLAKEGGHQQCVDYLLELERVDDACVILQVATEVAPVPSLTTRRSRL